MNKPVFALIILSFSVFVLATKCSNDPNVDISKTKKKIHIEEQWIQPPPDFDTLMFAYRTEYDRDGNPIDKKAFSRIDGSLQIHTIFKYDEHGNMKERLVDQPALKKTFQHFFEYKYNEDGQKVSMLETNVNDSMQFEHTYAYHDDGSYDDTIKYQSQINGINTYTADDKIIIEKLISGNSRTVIDYDEHGNLLRRVSYYPNNVEMGSEFKNEYNESGQFIRTSVENKVREYEYNENNDRIKETWYRDGEQNRIVNFKYTYYE